MGPKFYTDISTNRLRSFARYSGYAAVFSMLVMIVGSLVRATDSGLACPDWPMCYDRVIPMFDTQIFLEWIHRALALVLGICVAVLVTLVFRTDSLRRRFKWPMVLASIVFFIQVVLGGLTVLKLLEPKIVSFHLINAILFFSILVWCFFRAHAQISGGYLMRKDSGLVRIFGLLSVLLFAQLFLGGMVSTNHAGLACPDFPKCHGSWLPSFGFLTGLQVLHRFLGFGIFLLSIVPLFMERRRFSQTMFKVALFAPAAVVVQILLGAINVLYRLPTWASVLHLANGLVLYSIVLVGFFVSWYGFLPAFRGDTGKLRVGLEKLRV